MIQEEYDKLPLQSRANFNLEEPKAVTISIAEYNSLKALRDRVSGKYRVGFIRLAADLLKYDPNYFVSASNMNAIPYEDRQDIMETLSKMEIELLIAK